MWSVGKEVLTTCFELDSGTPCWLQMREEKVKEKVKENVNDKVKEQIDGP